MTSQNVVIDAVNSLGQAVYPILKDTHELQNTMKLIHNAVQDLANDRNVDREVIDTAVADLEQTATDVIQELSDLTATNATWTVDVDATIDDIRL